LDHLSADKAYGSKRTVRCGARGITHTIPERDDVTRYHKLNERYHATVIIVSIMIRLRA
jgi:hypothetical protein